MPPSLVRCLAVTAVLIGATAPALAGSGAVAIRYAMTLAGLPIGAAALDASVAGNGAYRIKVSARVGGILSLVSDGKGAATASGRMGTAKPMPTGYALNNISGNKQQTVQMVIADGAITDVAINPDLRYRSDRVPVTEADKRGVIDPVSAMLMPVAGGGETMAPAACDRTLAVFDGAQRFDIKLAYSRMDQVASKGYSGQAVVCSARYTPISGHRPDREQTKFMAANRDMEVWLAPVAGTRVLAPARIVVGTQIGRLVIAATRFAQGGGIADPTEANAN
ncbi:DUF3108 domain-containing protein [Labrys wisconsinensis]|uniref:DUF3108 domain-containing protein n=1 Tax=Labrys wisconsinensis TaxID=425677 RepID=A0ABU0J1C3_9HYPH|nr:DUF3108 domain-containing protein [Labrys wisconsinensis]MDQ0468052.1 hypothetical protein [Labrys wisconsinensis]